MVSRNLVNVVSILESDELHGKDALGLFCKLLSISADRREWHLATRYYTASVTLETCSTLSSIPLCHAIALFVPVERLRSAKALWERNCEGLDENLTRLFVLDADPNPQKELDDLLNWSCHHRIEVLCPILCEHGVGQRLREALECTAWPTISLRDGEDDGPSTTPSPAERTSNCVGGNDIAGSRFRKPMR